MIADSPVFLGVDGGGTRCRVRIRARDGAVMGEAVGGPANVYQNFDGALGNILAACGEAARVAGVALSDVHAGFGVAGIITSVGVERLQNAKLPFRSITADNDANAACIGAFSGEDGGIVIAGTGSIGLARVGGQRHMIGGWGFDLGDHGSGAWLGHHAVRRAALALDGLLQPTELINQVLDKAGRTRHDLSRWAERATPRDYASFAPLIFAQAGRADVQAMAIVIEGASAISKLGLGLLARGVTRLCLLGGLSGVYPPYLDGDVKAVLVPPEADAVDGAIMMARRAQGLPERWT